MGGRISVNSSHKIADVRRQIRKSGDEVVAIRGVAKDGAFLNPASDDMLKNSRRVDSRCSGHKVLF